MSKELFFVINPNAGNNKNDKWKNILSYLDTKNIPYNYYLTKSKNDAIERTPEFIKKGYRDFIVVGGDGTTNEVVNGIFSQTEVPYSEINLGSISLGTANDWNKYYGWESDIEKSIERILQHNISQQDLGVVSYFENGEKKTKYFVNSIGIGFDAEVVKMTNALSHEQRGKKMAYLFSLLKCLCNCKKINVKIQADDFNYSGKTLSISIAHGKFSGGGMQQTPDAILNDGKYDFVIYGDITKLYVIRHVSKLYDGTIKKAANDKVIFGRTENKINVEIETPTFAETDGELIGDGPYEITMIRNGLNVIN